MSEHELARKFHETYERLAPKFGYVTRKETREFDPTSPNGRLMIAVCGELLNEHDALKRELEGARKLAHDYITAYEKLAFGQEQEDA